MSQVENFSLGLEQIVIIVKLHVLAIDSTILITLVGTVVIFSTPSMLVFASWHHGSIKVNAEKEGAQLFLGIWVLHGVSQLDVTRIVVKATLHFLETSNLNNKHEFSPFIVSVLNRLVTL